MSEQLNGCPFCGRKPKIIQRPDSLDGYFCAIACFCGGHSARAHQFATDKESADAAYQKAKKLWNRRADIGITTTRNVPLTLDEPEPTTMQSEWKQKTLDKFLTVR